MSTTRIARLAAAVVAVAGLSVGAGPAPQASACRPMRTPEGVAACGFILSHGDTSTNPKTDRCHRKARHAKKPARAYARCMARK